jgi:hypothetical protein
MTSTCPLDVRFWAIFCIVVTSWVSQERYQYSLAEGEIPSDWRDAHIVPVFKKGKKHLPSNYRPISLTSIVCKVLGHIIHSNIMSHFDQYNAALFSINDGIQSGPVAL